MKGRGQRGRGRRGGGAEGELYVTVIWYILRFIDESLILADESLILVDKSLILVGAVFPAPPPPASCLFNQPPIKTVKSPLTILFGGPNASKTVSPIREAGRLLISTV